MRAIGVSKQRNEIISNSSIFWHVRLEQPLDFMVNKILGQSSLNVSRKSSDNPCPIYLRAKRTRDCFLLNVNNASRILYLIHCNL